MRLSRSRAIIFCVAFALISGGFIRAATAGQPCPSASPIAAAHEDHAAHHHPDGGTGKHSDAKCCGMCIVASAGIVPVQAEITEIRVTRIDYSRASAEIAGHIAVLDPGIPKRPA